MKNKHPVVPFVYVPSKTLPGMVAVPIAVPIAEVQNETDSRNADTEKTRDAGAGFREPITR